MPTYQYVCTGECGQLLEAVQSFSDAPLEECPTCGGRLRKKFSAVGVVFKGSGFYRTDSRSGAGSGGGAAKEPSGAKESTPSSGGDASTSSPSGSGSSGGSGSGSSGGSGSGSAGGSGSGSSGSGASGGTAASSPAKSA